MKITDVRVRRLTRGGKMKAIVSITIDNVFVVHDIKVLKGKKAYLSQCQAKKQPMGITEILHTRLIQKQEHACRK